MGTLPLEATSVVNIVDVVVGDVRCPSSMLLNP